MLRAIAMVLLAGCGAASSLNNDGGYLADGGQKGGVLCNDGYVIPLCRCRSSNATQCGTFCNDTAGAGIDECRANHAGLDGGYLFDTCAEAPVCD